MVRRACLIVAVFVETSTLVPRHVSDKCFSGAIVFSGWSSCDCKRADPHTVKLPVLVPSYTCADITYPSSLCVCTRV